MPDNLSPEQRAYCMSRIKGKDTGLERMVRSELHKRGLRFRKHLKRLPGKPDIVFSSAKVAVFVDGDFWHGYRFPSWRHKVSAFWQRKIEKNRRRDVRNFDALRSRGWMVIRIWEHKTESDFGACVARIADAVTNRNRLALLNHTGRGDESAG